MISVTITSRTDLAETDIRAMVALHRRYFTGVQEDSFRQDLAEKDWVILLRDAGRLAGFSTQKLIPLTVQERSCQFLFSGDTVVDQPYWNQPGLAGGWGHLALELADRHGSQNVYWFLICKGFRTYRFLPTFFRQYYPPANGGDDRLRPLLNAIAEARHGMEYNATSGIIHPARARDRLADDWATIAPHRVDDPHIAFFLAANPGWRKGDELACIAPISRDNLNALGQRVIRATAVTWAGACHFGERQGRMT